MSDASVQNMSVSHAESAPDVWLDLSLLGTHRRSSPQFPLEQVAVFLRPRLDRSLPIKERLKTLWAGCVAARDLGASNVIKAEFLKLGHESGIAEDLGWHGDADLKHVVRMAMLGINPFQ